MSQKALYTILFCHYTFIYNMYTVPNICVVSNNMYCVLPTLNSIILYCVYKLLPTDTSKSGKDGRKNVEIFIRREF